MLASILNSPKAIEINISIVRAFIALRQYALGYAELNQKLESFMIETNMQFNDIYQALTEMADKKEIEKSRNPIGYLKKIEFRHHGISVELLKEVIKYAIENNIQIIEAYPTIPTKENLPDTFTLIGLYKSF